MIKPHHTKIFYGLILAWALIVLCATLSDINAATEDTYVPISPIIENTAKGIDVSAGGIGNYLKNMFWITIGVAGVLGMIMLTYAGLEYVMSGSFTSKAEATKRIWAVVGGIILLLAAYIILNTINPKLLRFDFSMFGGSARPGPDGGVEPGEDTTGTQGFCKGRSASSPTGGSAPVKNVCDITPAEISSCNMSGCKTIPQIIAGHTNFKCDCREMTFTWCTQIGGQPSPTHDNACFIPPESITACENPPYSCKGLPTTIGLLGAICDCSEQTTETYYYFQICSNPGGSGESCVTVQKDTEAECKTEYDSRQLCKTCSDPSFGCDSYCKPCVLRQFPPK